MVNMGSFYHNRSGVVNACFGGIESKQRDSMYPGRCSLLPAGLLRIQRGTYVLALLAVKIKG